MKRLYLLVVFFSVVSAISAQNETITRELSKFTQVKVFDGLSVKLVPSDENKAIISGANTTKVAIVNNSGVLKLRMQINKLFSGYRTFVELHHTEKLVVLDVNEDARIVSDKSYNQDVLELKAQEGGEIQLNCETEQLLIKSVSGGDIITSGSADIQDVKINTGGMYDGQQLKTKFSTVSVNAGGEAYIYASEYVKANVKAGGKVLVHGNPSKIDEKKIFGGKIERIE